jgi:hypothetical protein
LALAQNRQKPKVQSIFGNVPTIGIRPFTESHAYVERSEYYAKNLEKQEFTAGIYPEDTKYGIVARGALRVYEDVDTPYSRIYKLAPEDEAMFQQRFPEIEAIGGMENARMQMEALYSSGDYAYAPSWMLNITTSPGSYNLVQAGNLVIGQMLYNGEKNENIDKACVKAYQDALAEFGLTDKNAYPAFRDDVQLEQAVMERYYDKLLENPTTAAHTLRRLDLYRQGQIMRG